MVDWREGGGGIDGRPWLAALKRGLVGDVGLVSQLPQFQRLGLIGWERLVVGGHEIRRSPLFDECLRMARESRHPALLDVVEKCRGELDEIDRRIGWAPTFGVGETIAALADADLPRDETPRQIIARPPGDMAALWPPRSPATWWWSTWPSPSRRRRQPVCRRVGRNWKG